MQNFIFCLDTLIRGFTVGSGGTSAWDGANRHIVCSTGACIVIDQGSTIVFVAEFAAGACFINETAVGARELWVSEFCSMPQASKKFGYDAREQ